MVPFYGLKKAIMFYETKSLSGSMLGNKRVADFQLWFDSFRPKQLNCYSKDA